MEKSLTQKQLEWAAVKKQEGQSLRRIAAALHISKSALHYDLEVSGLDYTPRPLKYEEDTKE